MAPPKQKRINGGINGPRLLEQEHGGALKAGGTPGHRGGTGRPPSKIREAARLAFSERIEVLTAIADDEEARASDRIRAIEVLAKAGGVDKLALTEEEQPAAGELTSEHVADLWEKMERIKSIKEFEKMLVGAAKKQSASREE